MFLLHISSVNVNNLFFDHFPLIVLLYSDFGYSLAYSMRKMMADKALVCMTNISGLSFHIILFVMWAMSIDYLTKVDCR